MPVGSPLDESAASVGDKGNRSLAFLCIEWVLGGLELAGPEKAEKAKGRNGGKEEASGPPGNVRGDKERDPSPTLRKHTRPERAESGKKAPESPRELDRKRLTARPTGCTICFHASLPNNGNFCGPSAPPLPRLEHAFK